MQNKKGLGNAKVIVATLIGILVAFVLFANLVPVAQQQGDNLSTTTSNLTGTPTLLPLGGLFSGSGIVFVLLMVGLLLFVIKKAM